MTASDYEIDGKTVYYGILRRGEHGPYLDTRTVSLAPAESLERALDQDAEYPAVGRLYPICGRVCLGESDRMLGGVSNSDKVRGRP